MAKARSRPEDAPAIDAAQLAAGAVELGLALSEHQQQLLISYAQLLLSWNRVYNLTAIREPTEVLRLHLLDSLSIVSHLDAFLPERASIVDIGAGGGLPGVPLAIVRPGYAVTLVDKVQKKVAFLTQAAAELRLGNVQSEHVVVERWRPAVPFDAVVARAYAPLAAFVGSTRHLLKPAGQWFAMKGLYPADEIEQLAVEHRDVEVIDAIRLRVPQLAAERHLIVMRAH